MKLVHPTLHYAAEMVTSISLMVRTVLEEANAEDLDDARAVSLRLAVLAHDLHKVSEMVPAQRLTPTTFGLVVTDTNPEGDAA